RVHDLGDFVEEAVGDGVAFELDHFDVAGDGAVDDGDPGGAAPAEPLVVVGGGAAGDLVLHPGDGRLLGAVGLDGQDAHACVVQLAGGSPEVGSLCVVQRDTPVRWIGQPGPVGVSGRPLR